MTVDEDSGALWRLDRVGFDIVHSGVEGVSRKESVNVQFVFDAVDVETYVCWMFWAVRRVLGSGCMIGNQRKKRCNVLKYDDRAHSTAEEAIAGLFKVRDSCRRKSVLKVMEERLGCQIIYRAPEAPS